MVQATRRSATRRGLCFTRGVTIFHDFLRSPGQEWMHPPRVRPAFAEPASS